MEHNYQYFLIFHKSSHRNVNPADGTSVSPAWVDNPTTVTALWLTLPSWSVCGKANIRSSFRLFPHVASGIRKSTEADEIMASVVQRGQSHVVAVSVVLLHSGMTKDFP